MDFTCRYPSREQAPKFCAKRYKKNKLWKLVDEFGTYIQNNQAFIVNYGEKYRYDETISTAFVESAVNELISRRMAKKQQMR